MKHLDVSDNVAQLPSATAIAEAIRRRVREKLNLTISAGVSCDKLIAKLASDENKPDGLCVVPPAKIGEFLKGRPLRQPPGIGPKTAERLERSQLVLVDDLLAADAQRRASSRQTGGTLFYICQGIDHRPVRRPKAAKQVSLERTFSEDIDSPAALHDKLDAFCEACWRRLCRVAADEDLPSELPQGRCGRTVTVKVKYADFSLQTRSQSAEDGVHSLNQLRAIAHLLLEPLLDDRPAIRLLGVGVSNWLTQDDPTEKPTQKPQIGDQITLDFEH